MAIFRPFAAYRPAPGLEHLIAALPYDVYSRREAAAVVRENPLSFLAIDRAETQFDESVDTYDDCVYEKARELLYKAVSEGKFIKDSSPGFYIYEMTMDGRTQTGIAGCASIDDYQNGIIKKHENMVANKELDRIRHVDTCNMQTGPIFLCRKHDSKLDRIVSEIKNDSPVCSFVSGNVLHRVWVASDPSVTKAISDCFAQEESLYIADGHHRCASAVKVGLMRREQNPSYTGDEEFNYFLSVVFPEEDLCIMDYNRVVRDLNGLTQEEFLAKLEESFEVQKESGTAPVRPSKRGEFGLCLKDGWYHLNLREDLRKQDPVGSLDVSVLQDLVLDPILGIKDPKSDSRIRFIGGIKGLDALEQLVKHGFAAAFSMYPTAMKELISVADEGLLMPPKSTWFEPKLLSGLFLHALA